MKSPAELFRETGDLESFKNAIILQNGNFNFDRDCMIELGAAYLEKYPDAFSNRKMDEIHLGYNIVRACVIEKMISNMDDSKKNAYRKILCDFSGSYGILENLIRTNGNEHALKDYEELSSEIRKIQDIIEDIPKGMIKERFIGGITNILNIMYLLKMKLKKN